MTQQERRTYLINRLISEQSGYWEEELPDTEKGQQELLRALMNVRVAGPIDDEYFKIQDEYLMDRSMERGIVEAMDLPEIQPSVSIWKGDITTLKCDAIVNAANSGMTGCYRPSHRCIDNCIHTFAGIQLRNYCFDIMQEQGHDEPVGSAKITPAFNLPCKYIIHTVGPNVFSKVTDNDMEALKNCYESCLQLAEDQGLSSLAFCCISTGVFLFPSQLAAEIATSTVLRFLKNSTKLKKVIFDVFTIQDERIYTDILKKNAQ